MVLTSTLILYLLVSESVERGGVEAFKFSKILIVIYLSLSSQSFSTGQLQRAPSTNCKCNAMLCEPLGNCRSAGKTNSANLDQSFTFGGCGLSLSRQAGYRNQNEHIFVTDTRLWSAAVFITTSSIFDVTPRVPSVNWSTLGSYYELRSRYVPCT